MGLESLQDLLEDTVKDIYSAETQMLKAMPRLTKAATSPELQKALQQHLTQTQEQVKRLEQVAESLGIRPTGKKCAGMEGLIKEAQEILSEGEDEDALDARIICAVQKVEHYEIASYGCARTYAQELGHRKAAQLLERTLKEEAQTDQKLTQIAERAVNRRAKEAEQEEAASRKSAGSQKSGSASRSKSSKSSGRSSRASSGSSKSGGKSSGSSSRSSSSSSKSSSSSSRSSKSGGSKSAGKSSARSGGSSRSGNGSSSGNVTTDHEEIRRWVEERGGHPACVRGTGNKGDTGLLRIDYPGYSGEQELEEISWDDFFEKFDQEKLAFLFQEQTADGKESRFSKLISRASAKK